MTFHSTLRTKDQLLGINKNKKENKEKMKKKKIAQPDKVQTTSEKTKKLLLTPCCLF